MCYTGKYLNLTDKLQPFRIAGMWWKHLVQEYSKPYANPPHKQ